jgi:NDP-sugar pyrophosphorylase family protein
MNIIVFLSDHTPRIENSSYPTCLTEIGGIPLLELLVKQVKSIDASNYIFTMNQEDVKKFHLKDALKLLLPKANVLEISNIPEGDACTSLLAWGLLAKDQPLIIVNGNVIIKEDFNKIISDFIIRDLDAGCVVFHSIHPKYAFVKIENGLIIEAAYHRPISTNACADFYYFKSASIFIEAAQMMIKKDVRGDGVFSIATVFNQMLLDHMRIGIYSITKDHFIEPKSENLSDR